MLPGLPRIVTILCITLFGMMLLMPGNAASQDLKTGDGVRLTFYNIEDNVSGDYFVMQDWTLQLPYIGQMNVRDRGFDALRDSIIYSYQNIYREPELTVQPLFRINILGEVRNSGIYYVTGFERLSDLLAMAGGRNPRSRSRQDLPRPRRRTNRHQCQKNPQRREHAGRLRSQVRGSGIRVSRWIGQLQKRVIAHFRHRGHGYHLSHIPHPQLIASRHFHDFRVCPPWLRPS